MKKLTSKNFIKQIKQTPQDFYIIHYSCEDFNDEEAGQTPRITGIIIQNFNNEEIATFSWNSASENIKSKPKDKTKDMDKIEQELLTRYYTFITSRRDKYWVHWNMNSEKYGFKHLANRFTSLTNKPPIEIDAEMLVNLDGVLKDLFGNKYVEHPRMEKLMSFNGGIHRDFKNGQHEPLLFTEKNYIELNDSTTCKVQFFRQVMKQLIEGTLRTDTKPRRAAFLNWMKRWLPKLLLALLPVIAGYLLYPS